MHDEKSCNPLFYKILSKQITVQLNGGVRNIFNSFQNDVDKGMNRDYGYIYGPELPHTFFFGIKIGQF